MKIKNIMKSNNDKEMKPELLDILYLVGTLVTMYFVALFLSYWIFGT